MGLENVHVPGREFNRREDGRRHSLRAVRVGIVVPFSWSYIGGVGEHAECQAEALDALGVETRLIIGDDPPRSLSRLIHPDASRDDAPPSRLVSVGTSVVA